MTREERVARAYGLRYVGGWTMQKIADELGVVPQTVSRWLEPERTRRQSKKSHDNRRCAARLYADKNERGTCVSCGGDLHVGSKYDGTRQCLVCFRSLSDVKAGEERQAETVKNRVELDDVVHEAWHRGLADGSSPKEIALSLGMTRDALLTTVACMRKAGRDLPRAMKMAS